MKLHLLKLAACISIFTAGAAFAGLFGSGRAVVVPAGNLKWVNLGIPGVDAAVVSGDMKKGASRFFLRYPKGLETPVHYHTADHYATVVSGSITLRAAGKTQRLEPGSYFALTGKIKHVAKVEGDQEAVFFIQADGPWDAVFPK